MSQVTLRIPAPLRPLVGNSSQLAVEAGTVRDALRAAGGQYAPFVERILDENGELHTFVNVFVGSTNVMQLEGLDTPVAENDVLAILPAVAGGWSQ